MSDTTRAPEPSGRFLLRISPELHRALRDAAVRSGLSLNEYCARTLAAPGSGWAGPLGEAVAHARRVIGGALVGVIVFGSWARGEASEESDVDLLVIVDRDRPIARALYRVWEETEEPLRLGSHRIEPHFVHLPEPDDVSGLWAEAAMDGVVLFERGVEVSTRLGDLRRAIASDVVERREAGGHPYWVRAV